MKDNWLKRAWNYVWHGDSIGSLLASIILIFIIVRYIVYPIGGLLVGTQFPIVAVVSGSMEHEDPTKSWINKHISTQEWWQSECCTNQFCTEQTSQSSTYEDYNITLDEFSTYRFPNGFNKGDIMILANPENAQVGDTIVFFSERRAEPIIHRMIYTDGSTYRTKGDNNCAIASFEQSIPSEYVVGKAIARIPWLGYIKILFVELLSVFGIGGGI